jgi:hypothetical protein
METEHIYWGSSSQDADWIVVSFMENVDENNTMKKWVDVPMMLARCPITPIHDGQDRGPNIQTWNYLGSEPAFKDKMKADETHCFMGTATYKRSFTMLSRIYIVLVRRKRFAWKISLSFMSACFDGMPDALIESNDHVRAGAILGELKLGGIGLGAEQATGSQDALAELKSSAEQKK